MVSVFSQPNQFSTFIHTHLFARLHSNFENAIFTTTRRNIRSIITRSPQCENMKEEKSKNRSGILCNNAYKESKSEKYAHTHPRTRGRASVSKWSKFYADQFLFNEFCSYMNASHWFWGSGKNLENPMKRVVFRPVEHFVLAGENWRSFYYQDQALSCRKFGFVFSFYPFWKL